MTKELTGYDYSRMFWDYSFNNPEHIKPYHAAVFFFAVEHCNRLGWKKKFGLPTSMVMEATGIKSYNKYKEVFDQLVEYGFFELIETSKNQYSSNIVALSCRDKAQYKALDKALMKHSTKHHTKHSESTVQSTGESTDSIDKQVNKEQLNNKPLNKEQESEDVFINPFGENFTAWQGWKDYKREEHRESYRSPKTETAAAQKLFKLARGNPETAKKIILQSIENRWKGLFELKIENNGNRNTGKTEYGTPERAAEYERLFAQRYGGGGSTVG
jgi:hypothetical protein